MKSISVRDTEALLSGEIKHPSSALVLLHGRGSTAHNILSFAQGIHLPHACLLIAPHAPGDTWYPRRFIVPQKENEPHLSQSLAIVDDTVAHILNTYTLSTNHIAFFGFSQGACLTAEYLKGNPSRFLGAVLMSGGLIGTDEEIEKGGGDLENTPIYLGCDRTDPHIPSERVLATDRIFTKLGADAHAQLYTGLGHAVHPDAVAFLSKLFDK